MLLRLLSPKRNPPGAWGFLFAAAAWALVLHALL
jgi:hypothetical protein